MDKNRLLQLAGVEADSISASSGERIILNEEYDDVNITKVATSIPTEQMVNLVAEHLWHQYTQDEDVERFIDAVRTKLAENRNRTQ